MSKPSIFSKQYQRKMKRRKTISFITVISIATLAMVFFIIGGDNLKVIKNSINKVFSKDNKIVQTTIEKPNQAIKIDTTKIEEKKQDEEKKEKEQEPKYYEVTMASGGIVKISYDETNAEKKLLTVSESNDYSSYDINPSKNAAILVDSKSQDLILVNGNGEIKKITNPSYKSQSQGKTYSKDSILAGSPQFLWDGNAKFIDDTHIVYLTNLPYFDKNQNIWVCDTATASHRAIYGSKAKDIRFNEIKDGALEVVIDGATKYIQPNGAIIQR